MASTAVAERVRTESVGLADKSGGTWSNIRVSDWPVQRSASIPSRVWSTTAPSAPERITASCTTTVPLAFEVRRIWTRRPSERSRRLPGESK